VISLCTRFPVTSADHIVEAFTPPPRFADVRLANYIPNPAEPSQSAALAKVSEFAQGEVSSKRKLFSKSTPQTGKGIYLDGGFGVGKTHLLAALFFEFDGSVAYASFVEYTNLVGALGFEKTVQALSQFKLVCIDEFELDDPGDTVLMSTLLNRLADIGVSLAATSNTLPDRLGEDRFAADDFMREIQGLAAHFEIIRIEGPDYRHRESDVAAPARKDSQLDKETPDYSFDEMSQLDAHLQKVHPSAYAKVFQGVRQVQISNLATITHQANALRWVVFIDRMYDLQIPFAYSGISLEQLFSEEMKKGGYRKKYFRALSRISALSREAN
jgi:cell division protein ZapE